jgi:hypothetical protein
MNDTAQAWQRIEPRVHAEAEFFEILNDFGDPLELLREAVSNSYDAQATWVKIEFSVKEIEGRKCLVTRISDNGKGMSREVLQADFWGLGYSTSRDRAETIGEKGHGTKIFLRSEQIIVETQSDQGAARSECLTPLASLAQRKLHSPRIIDIQKFQEHNGTNIEIVGYNNNERSKFVRDVVKDYLLWFTKLGSVDVVLGADRKKNFKVLLKCLDQEGFEEIEYGHPFPNENSDINKLFDAKGASAADWFVKRFVFKAQRLKNHPEVTFDVAISVEGDAIKREYNPMLRLRRTDAGRYRVGDRYGIWLCKDHIPVTRVNDWLSGFGSGSNAYVLLHGFINCQALKLTANRGDVANTDPVILEELKVAVQDIIGRIDGELNDKGLYTLRGWQEESLTLEQERKEFHNRTKKFRNRRVAVFAGRVFPEPQNESELFGLFTSIYSLHPDLFDFEPIDYNTSRGVDIIGRNKSPDTNLEGENWYIELKYLLQSKRFNHAYEHLRWIIVWDFDKNIGVGSEFQGIEETDTRKLETGQSDSGEPVYFLSSPKKAKKIQIIRLREFLKLKLGIEFDLPKP